MSADSTLRFAVETQGSDLDREYIEGWVDRLGLREEWDQASALEHENRGGD